MDGTSTYQGAARDLLSGIKVVDADTHVSEWYDLWTSRAPAKYKDRVPHFVDSIGWVIDGQPMNRDGAVSAVRKDGSKTIGTEFRHLRLPDVHPGAYDVKARVKHMDEEGVWAQIAYPNLLGFGGQAAFKLDEDLRNVCTHIFNDAMAEMQEQSGNRIFPMAMMPWWDVKLAAKEARRCADMGMRGINMNSDPDVHGLPHLGQKHWQPLWDTCIDNQLPVNFHIGASDESMTWVGKGLWPGHPDNIALAYGSVMLFVGNFRVLTNLFLTRFLEDLPDLKLVSVESGAGWIPFMLEGIEYQLGEAGVKPKVSPTELFARQIYACTWFERRHIVQTARQIGIDNILFESDFPHPTCLYPDPLGQVSDALAAMTQEERQKMLGGNAIKLYNLGKFLQ